MTAKYFELTKERLGDVHEAKWEYGDQQSIGKSNITIDEEAVMLRLDKLRDDKAAGADELIPRFFNKIKLELLDHLPCFSARSWITNRSLEIGSRPT